MRRLAGALALTLCLLAPAAQADEYAEPPVTACGPQGCVAATGSAQRAGHGGHRGHHHDGSYCRAVCTTRDEVRVVYQMVEEKVCIPGLFGHCGTTRTVRRIIAREIRTQVPAVGWELVDPCGHHRSAPLTPCEECQR